jgi:hypothetical protein
MEDGADILIKAEKEMPTPEILESEEDESDKDTEVEGND